MSSSAPMPTSMAGDSPSWTNHCINFVARRRIAISLIGFISLVSYNIIIRQPVPLDPSGFSQPLVAVAWGLLVAGLAIRSWAAGTLNKSRELTTHGPYALTRNPLYVGSFMMMFGFCIFCRDWLTLAFAAGPMAGLYWLQILFEEQRLRGLFPAEWDGYVQRVPRVIPRFMRRSAFSGWTTAEWMRNREYRALAASAVGMVLIYAWHWFRTAG